MLRRRTFSEEPKVGEANVLPVMNIMFLLIPALLLAMEVASMASVAVSPPKLCGAGCSDSENTEEPKKALNLKVVIRSDGYTLKYAGTEDGKQAAESDGPSIGLERPNAPADDYDRYDYAALEARAAEFIEAYPHETRVTVTAESDIPAQVLISTMDALRGTDCKMAGFAAGDERREGCYFYEPVVEAGGF
ncbi:hypothetical protein PPSIR1_19624 [Plesiocystis pacifica SIR-1]|uniref:Biopolymer transport protein ExbD/TolR n=1 Tax=Plesiocystis pacifica SIR-1 TaxID=391625 RepID=A6GAM4_9BACT|nr:biopolymer transporter ExbD [Plesiocystis pacifica]EDM77086.1 hypothetical protein PPSIR1_19624 [Plesiocystis pacifica SIR-1]